MAAEPSSVEQAVSRALRDNLARLQSTAEELHQAVADMVAACASSRPTNALPPMLRAQTAAASLAAALEVLSRFVTAALQPGQRTPAEAEVLRVVSLQPPEPASPTLPSPSIPVPMGGSVTGGAPAEASQAADMIAEGAPIAPPEAVGVTGPMGDPAVRHHAETAATTAVEESADKDAATGELIATFELASLPAEQQELHRRANRVAKVSMQDIMMLRPGEVRLGREHKDLCLRLRDDIENAHKEYDRRFRSIQGHPVDYFYHWMVEILAGGNSEALGEYPYPSPLLRR